METENATKKRTDFLIDDVSFPSDSQVRLLRNAVVYLKRHLKLNVYILVHSMRGNKLSISQAGQCDFAVFMYHIGKENNASVYIYIHSRRIVISGNSKNFYDYIRDAAGKSKSEAEDVWNNFMAQHKPFTCLRYNRRSGTFDVLNGKGMVIKVAKRSKKTNSDERRTLLKAKLQRYSLSSHVILLYDYLTDNGLDVGCISDTLEIKLQSKKTKKKISTNLLDVLHYASNPNVKSSEILPADKAIFHELRTMSNMPRCLILNPLFK